VPYIIFLAPFDIASSWLGQTLFHRYKMQSYDACPLPPLYSRLPISDSDFNTDGRIHAPNQEWRRILQDRSRFVYRRELRFRRNTPVSTRTTCVTCIEILPCHNLTFLDKYSNKVVTPIMQISMHVYPAYSVLAIYIISMYNFAAAWIQILLFRHLEIKYREFLKIISWVLFIQI
jgi:hypothetical protein